MRVKIRRIPGALHPNEAVVSVRSTTGPQKLVVHERSIERESIEIGYPIDQSADSYLVELPRETVDGSWRIWVPRTEVFDLEQV